MVTLRASSSVLAMVNQVTICHHSPQRKLKLSDGAKVAVNVR